MIAHHHEKNINHTSLFSFILNWSATIILLHGFMGWGRDEMGKYYYWGGFTDLQKYLQMKDLMYILYLLGLFHQIGIELLKHIIK